MVRNRSIQVLASLQQKVLGLQNREDFSEGLIRREADPTDSRATRIYLTQEGRDAYDRLWPHMADSHVQMFRGIPEDEQRAFVGTLQKILRNVRVHDF